MVDLLQVSLKHLVYKINLHYLTFPIDLLDGQWIFYKHNEYSFKNNYGSYSKNVQIP